MVAPWPLAPLGATSLYETLMGVSLALLFVGFLMKDRQKHLVRIAGWVGFAAYWPTQADYYLATGDPFNYWLSWIGPLLVLYIAWHEWRSYAWHEDPKALRWLSGTTAIATATFFAFAWLPALAVWTQYVTGIQTVWMLEGLFGIPSEVRLENGDMVNIYLTNDPSLQPYAVTIILACTAIQSMMIFVGAIATLDAPRQRKMAAYLMTIPAIHVMNLFRNSGIVYGYKVLEWNPFSWGAAQPAGWKGWFWYDLGGVGLAQGSFEWMHAWVGKWGSLGALILVALAVFAVLPELHGHILDLFDLPKRRKAGFYQEPTEPVKVVAEA